MSALPSPASLDGHDKSKRYKPNIYLLPLFFFFVVVVNVDLAQPLLFPVQESVRLLEFQAIDFSNPLNGATMFIHTTTDPFSSCKKHPRIIIHFLPKYVLAGSGPSVSFY